MSFTPSRRQYRRYLRDASAPVPRATLWRHRHHRSKLSSPQITAKTTISSPWPSSQFSLSTSGSSLISPDLSQTPVESSSALSPSLSPSTSSVNESLSPSTGVNEFLSPSNSVNESLSPSASVNESLSPSTSVNESLSPSTSVNESLSPTSANDSSSPSEAVSSPDELDSSPAQPNNGHRDSSSSQFNLLHNSSAQALLLQNAMHNHEPNDAQSTTGSQSRPPLFEPLYDSAKITVCGAICAIMHFCMANKLSYAAITDLLKLLVLLCPAPNQLPTSVYLLKKFFEQFRPCNDCKRVCMRCQSSDCQNKQHLSHSTADLVHLDIQKALQWVVSENWDNMHQVNHRSQNGNLEDVWDGSVLNELSAPNRFFSNPCNLALTLFTDGVPLYKSSSVSIWPVYVVVLNLAASIRMNADNVILCGIWKGPSKPIMHILLDPITKYMQKLLSVGIQVKNSTGECRTFRAKLVMGVFDLPAKASVLSFKQFNGEHGCSVCLHPGKRLHNNSRVYLPNNSVDERSHQQVLKNAIKAERTKTCINGVYGMSPLAHTFDLVNSVPIDYMHAVLEGVTRMLTRMWIDSKFHSAPFYIGPRRLAVVDHELLKQSPPSEFSRPPRSIQKHFNYWKASELRSWLLFYSLPLLLDVLPALYWHHFALLVNSMHIMLSNNISASQLDAAEHMLHDFHTLLPELYGEASCTANAHLLCHLVKYVRLWGPLWTQSAFGFESKNGMLKHLFHGKNDILHQLLFNVDISYIFKEVRSSLSAYDNEQTVQYVSQLTQRPNMISMGAHIYIVGKCTFVRPTPEQANLLGCSSTNIKVFFRLYKNGVMYHSTSYKRSTNGKRNNTFCCYCNESNGILMFAQINLFVNTAERQLCALVHDLQVKSESMMKKAGNPCRRTLSDYQQVDLLKNYMFPAHLPDRNNSPLTVIPVQSILSKIVLVTAFSSNSHYFIIQPNTVERH